MKKLYTLLYIFLFFFLLSLPNNIYPGEFRFSTLKHPDIAIRFWKEEKLIGHKKSLCKRTKILLRKEI